MTQRVRGMADWRPQGKTIELLHHVQKVLVEYAEFLPLAVRVIFYRLVGDVLDKSERHYKNLAEILNRARRAGLIPFEDISDNGGIWSPPQYWTGAPEMVEACSNTANNFRFNRQRGQPQRLVLACEAQGMAPQLVRVAAPYGILVVSSGGFESTSEKYRLAYEFRHCEQVEVLHVGDFDPSGVAMFDAKKEDVQALARDLGYATDWTFTRVAVRPEHITEYNLPTAPPKRTDKRGKFVATRTVQAEALAPNILADLIHKAIRDRIDWGVLEAVKREEAEVRSRVGPEFQELQRRYGPVRHRLRRLG